MAKIIISGNNFYDHSRAIGEQKEYNFNWSELQREAAALKDKAETDTELASAVAELQTAINCKEENSVKRAVGRYAAAFSSATFANLASAGVLALVKAFLP